LTLSPASLGSRASKAGTGLRWASLITVIGLAFGPLGAGAERLRPLVCFNLGDDYGTA
tara:strand:+ start:1609 stop:1782 length:174 start_codon:yes stop_codon:yes gene_type:complete